MGDDGRHRAIGGIGSDNLSNVRGVAVAAVASRDASGEGESSSGDGGEAHFDRLKRVLGELRGVICVLIKAEKDGLWEGERKAGVDCCFEREKTSVIG